MSLKAILSAQLAWVGDRPRRGHVLDRVEDNLFQPLHPRTYAEFADGSGDELGLGGRTGKMRSLRSSSALACNVFDAWRGKALMPLVRALDASGDFTELAFEQKVNHGLGSFPPNLDVLLSGSGIAPLGIEAKFAEPYGYTRPRPPLASKYFPVDHQRWGQRNLPRSQRLAEGIGKSVQFVRLDAAQLLKHILGLATQYPEFRTPRLRYVWFDASGAADDEHRAEIDRFRDFLSGEIDFAAIPYQDLFGRVLLEAEPAPGYTAYLASRYFAG